MSLLTRLDDADEELKLNLLELQTEAAAGFLIECLDDGFVRLVDSMGGDSAIARAARTSYGKGTKSVNDDRNLIRYLMRHWHTTPFEMCEFIVPIPMDAWRQMIRHRTASINEYSTRYSEAIDSDQAILVLPQAHSTALTSLLLCEQPARLSIRFFRVVEVHKSRSDVTHHHVVSSRSLPHCQGRQRKAGGLGIADSECVGQRPERS